ncbi:MAG: hypothetical protein RL681_860 [Candidatus Parcubacteria bacterium]|jgi:S1-C subfamily serine protease
MADEQRVIETIKKVMPSVVSIMISKHLEDVEKELPHGLYPFLPGQHRRKKDGGKHKPLKLPDFLVDPDGMVSVGGGSGFCVAPGLILTNKHVITELNATYTVITNDGEKFPAEVLSRDPINDVALLMISKKDLPALELGDAAKLELGQSVIAIGNALGIFKNTVSLGIVSGLSRAISASPEPGAKSQELRGLIQTDAAVNVGNSGGPLVDLEGRVVGVNAAIISGAHSIGFAIPISAAKRDLADIQQFGRIRRPLLGVRYLMVDEKLQQKMKLPESYGALVVKEGPQDHAVVPGSPADEIGIREHDVILELNGKRLDAEHCIQDYLESVNVGDSIALTIWRNGNTFTARVPLTSERR